ncbi:hypothetical protein [Roseobacter sinensis]|uniref:Uncharacterized protein n=1 Tax=Roseobacter sinensis TaxID=2931391 RepID=A0ABT3BK71_9RHOB|nr:hypothetical protein [Roseobacter sp. WL0113]MCV3273623.1 hypothetical protein [Roseobacter sp. WL0113]
MSYALDAICYVPPEGLPAEFGAVWPGCGTVGAQKLGQPDVPGLHDIGTTPRKDRFHRPRTPLFRVRKTSTVNDLDKATAALVSATCYGPAVTASGGCLAPAP